MERVPKIRKRPPNMGNGPSDSCCGLWAVDDRKCIERADRLHKSELYACRSWVYNVRHVERLLKKKRVAPFERGVCFLLPPGFVECPICFLVWKDTTSFPPPHHHPTPFPSCPAMSNTHVFLCHRVTATSTGPAAATSQFAQVCTQQPHQRESHHHPVHCVTECALQIEPNLNRAKSRPCPFCRRTGFRVRWERPRCHKDVAVTTISTTPAPVGPSSTNT